MRTKISTKKFLIELKKHEKICKAKTSCSLLDGVLLSYDENNLSIISNTMENSIQSFLPCKSTGENKLLFPYDKLLKIVSKIKNEEFIIEDNTIIDDKLKFTLIPYSLEDYPELPIIENKEIFTFNFHTDILKESLNFVSQDDSQCTLNGVSLQGARLASIDGRRLYAYNFTPVENFQDVIIHESILNIIAKNEKFEILEVKQDNENVQIIVNDTFYTSKKIQGKFPNIDMFIFKESHSGVNLNSKEILTCMDRLSVLVDKESNKMIFSDTKISVQNADYGEASAEIWQCGSFPYIFGLNYKIFSDILKICPEEITLKFKSDTQSQIQIDFNNKNIVFMPMKLD